MRRVTAGILLVVLIASVAGADDNKASWENLQKLKPGQNIRVVTLNSKDFAGKFQRFSQDDIVINVRQTEVSVRRTEVQRVDVRKAYKRVLHGLAGAGVGLAIGLAIVFGSNSEDAFYGNLPWIPVITGGTTVAAAWKPGYVTLYKAP